jgi:hypothetical protein
LGALTARRRVQIAGLKIHTSPLGLAESQAIMDGDTARIGAQLIG